MRVRLRIAWVMLAAALGACGGDLGRCEISALGGSSVAGMAKPHDGQAIVGTSCAGGRCHSESAKGATRSGAPSDLDFDVLASSATDEEIARITRGSALVIEHDHEIWAQIEAGTMPPAAPAGSGELSGEDKESVRNWLACGAEVIGPDRSAPPSTTWEGIWPELAPSCVGCHGSESGASAGMGFVLGDLDDACGSYDRIVGETAVTPDCAGMTVVVRSDPDASLLLQKLNATASCGVPMPLGAEGGLVATKPELVARIMTWIGDGAAPPEGCP